MAEGIKNYDMQRCPKCQRVKIGEVQSFCRNCGHISGSDRWFSTEDELLNIKVVD